MLGPGEKVSWASGSPSFGDLVKAGLGLVEAEADMYSIETPWEVLGALGTARDEGQKPRVNGEGA